MWAALDDVEATYTALRSWVLFNAFAVIIGDHHVRLEDIVADPWVATTFLCSVAKSRQCASDSRAAWERFIQSGDRHEGHDLNTTLSWADLYKLDPMNAVMAMQLSASLSYDGIDSDALPLTPAVGSSGIASEYRDTIGGECWPRFEPLAHCELLTLRQWKCTLPRIACSSVAG